MLTLTPADVATLIPAIAIAVMGIFFVTRASDPENKTITKLQPIVGFSLMFIGFTLYTPYHPPLIARIIAVSAIHIGTLLVCLSRRDILLPSVNPLPRRLTATIIVISIATNVIDILRGENDGLYLKGEQFRPTVEYLLYAWFLLGNLTITSVIFAKTHLKAANNSKSHTFRVKMYMLTTTHSINIFNTLLAPLNLSLYYLGFRLFFSEINAIFYILLDLSFICVLLAFLPNRMFKYVFYPLISLLDRIEQNNQRKMRELHRLFVQLAPLVQLPDRSYQEARQLVEISHARRIVWSHNTMEENISANDEVTRLQNLASQGISFESAGNYPPPPKLPNPKQYYKRLSVILDKRSHRA